MNIFQNLTLLRSLVWTDYRLAVLFMVVLPIVLLIWAFVKKADAMQHVLMIYWRVASLLAVTVYLMIGGLSVSFVSALMARLLIPISLWFWVDLNDEIEDQSQTPLKLVFNAWRWAVSIYNLLGAIALLFFLPCAFSIAQFRNPTCQVWLEAPLKFKEYFHPNTSYRFLGFLGIIGLVIYVFYLGYFVLIRLGKQGRSAASH